MTFSPSRKGGGGFSSTQKAQYLFSFSLTKGFSPPRHFHFTKILTTNPRGAEAPQDGRSLTSLRAPAGGRPRARAPTTRGQKPLPGAAAAPPRPSPTASAPACLSFPAGTPGQEASLKMVRACRLQNEKSNRSEAGCEGRGGPVPKEALTDTDKDVAAAPTV